MQSAKKNPISIYLRALISFAAVAVIVWLFRPIDGSHTAGVVQPKNPVSITAESPAIPVLAPANAPTTPIMKEIATPNGIISAEVASSETDRERGLSGRTSFAADSGMLFVFPEDGVYGFWMKDMKFSIDIVWMSSDKRVSGVVKSVSPDTYPKIFYPPIKARYVLELPAGSADEHLIVAGSRLSF